MLGVSERSQSQVTSDSISKQDIPAVHTTQTLYSLVVASQVPMSGAQKLVDHLHKSGYAEARVLQRHNMVRVVIGRYVSYDEARKALKQMRQKSAEFTDTWVLKDENAQ